MAINTKRTIEHITTNKEVYKRLKDIFDGIGSSNYKPSKHEVLLYAVIEEDWKAILKTDAKLDLFSKFESPWIEIFDTKFSFNDREHNMKIIIKSGGKEVEDTDDDEGYRNKHVDEECETCNDIFTPR